MYCVSCHICSTWSAGWPSGQLAAAWHIAGLCTASCHVSTADLPGVTDGRVGSLQQLGIKMEASLHMDSVRCHACTAALPRVPDGRVGRLQQLGIQMEASLLLDLLSCHSCFTWSAGWPSGQLALAWHPDGGQPPAFSGWEELLSPGSSLIKR